MSFSSCLQKLMDEVGCTAQQVAEAAGMSPSTMSRYLTGSRTPRPASDAPDRIAAALGTFARENGRAGFDERRAADALRRACGDTGESDNLARNLGQVTTAFDIANNQLARHMGFDPSYISRILAGTRTPGDSHAFADGVSTYLVRNRFDEAGIATAADLTGKPVDELRDPKAFAQAIRQFIETNDAADQAPSGIGSFLEKLDEFDLNDFLRGIRFDELKVPTAPFQLPTRKTYTGVEQMKQAEIDFLKAAVLARATDDVIMYSDLPIADLAADDEFPRKVMMGIALLVRKGVHLHMIHDVHRPVSELFMGLEGWIPVYMTGQISPYYLPQPTNSTFMHFIRSAATVAIDGEAIAGHHEAGRYTLMKNAGDVAYMRTRAQDLLSRAKPLLRIFQAEQDAELKRVLGRLDAQADRKGAESIAIGEDTFQNMRITVRCATYALIEKVNPPQMRFLIDYPALVDALERFEPTLF